MKILVDVENGEKILKLKQDLGTMGEEILKVNTAMKAQGATTAEVAAHLSSFNPKLNAATQEIKSLEAGSGSLGRGLGQLSYAIDDVQYGFNAIVNNIPQIVMGLGGGAGLAGALGIAAVATNQLIKHWTELTAAFEVAWTGGSYDQLVTLKERVEAATAAYEKLQKAKTQWEDKGGKKVEQGIADEGADKIRTQIAGALIAGGHIPLATDEDFKNAQGVGVKGMRAKGATDAQIQEEKKKEQMERARIRAEQLMTELSAGGIPQGAARDMMKRLEKENPDVFKKFPEFKKGLNESDPDAIQEQEREDKKDKARAKEEEGAKKIAEIKKKDETELRKKIHDRIAGEKQAKIQSLEDERAQAHSDQKVFDDYIWKKREAMGKHGQILSGAKAATDYYQTGSGKEDAKAIAKEAHEQRQTMNKKLESIDAELKKERRLVVPH